MHKIYLTLTLTLYKANADNIIHPIFKHFIEILIIIINMYMIEI